MTMPKYRFKCEACGGETHVQQEFDDAPMTHCLKCNGAMNRIIASDMSIQFKGSGFFCAEKNNPLSD
jgi:putative FmdB family regulatory protein